MEGNARLARRRWRARHKTRRRRPARAGWHSFGEYAFLEDSRYASQRENAGAASGVLAIPGWQCFWRATIANIFRARRLSPSRAALAREALRIVSDRRERVWGRNGDEGIGCAARLVVASPGRRDRCDGACARSAARVGG